LDEFTTAKGNTMRSSRAVRKLACGFVLCIATFASAKPLPEIALKDLSGQKQRLSALKGNIVVLNFWATWCGPCQEELPLLSRLSGAYGSEPVRFVAVSIDEQKSRDQIASFLFQRNIKLDTWTGATTGTMAKAGLGDIVPSTLILDQAGDVITRITGEAREDDIRGSIDWLLKGRQGQAPEASLNRR
jgi:thiol-disulfide isomerase/thioredoxin